MADVPPAEADLRPVPRDDAGGLDTPTPPPRPALTPEAQELEKVAAEAAAAIAARESGARNDFGQPPGKPSGQP